MASLIELKVRFYFGSVVQFVVAAFLVRFLCFLTLQHCASGLNSVVQVVVAAFLVRFLCFLTLQHCVSGLNYVVQVVVAAFLVS